MRGFTKITIFLMGLCFLAAPSAYADKPVEWQLGFQEAVTPVMERVVELHDLMLWIQFIISGFVAFLLFYIIFRFRASRNPSPNKVTHNTTLEVIWTAIPVVVLLFIAFPSLRLLYYMDVTPEADMTVKAIGNQWYWTYEYPDHDIGFDSYLIESKDLKPGDLRLLEVDNRVVVPVNTNIRLITTSNDVLHSWTIPAFGIKKDSVPGRLNETWFNIQKEGVYYGQCSELCGPKHGYMPIVVEAVSKARFDHWVSQNKEPEASPKKDQTTEEGIQPVSAAVPAAKEGKE